MNEIEKLYRLANIESFIHNQPVKDYNFGGHDGYKYNEVKCYPSFTTEKQLKLIKWLGKFCPLTISFSIDSWYIKIYGEQSGIDHLVVDNYFDEGVSSLINTIWQDLTEEEKQQIKETLE